MSQEPKKRVAFVKQIVTKNGLLDKLSIELNQIGQVAEKEGKTYLILDDNCKALNKYEKEGQETRYFLNMNMNRYTSITLDEYQREGGGSSSSGAQQTDDLPF